MLLRKGRFTERRRVAYRLVGMVRGESHVLSDELYADAREAQAAVESAVPENAPLDQVALQRGVLSSPQPPLSTAFDSLGCRWEVIKRWGPDVIARIRRQRESGRTDARVLTQGEAVPIAPAPAIASAAPAEAAPADVPPPDVAREDFPQPESVEAALLEPALLGLPSLPAATSEATPTPEFEPSAAVDPDPIAAPADGAFDDRSSEPPADLTVPRAEAPACEIAVTDSAADDCADLPFAAGPEASDPPAASGARPPTDSPADAPAIPLAAADAPPLAATEPVAAPSSPTPAPAPESAPRINPTSPAPLRYRPWRGAVIRTAILVGLLLLAVVAFESCSNPFAWLTSESFGNEIHSLPFQNHAAAPAAHPAGEPSPLAASVP